VTTTNNSAEETCNHFPQSTPLKQWQNQISVRGNLKEVYFERGLYGDPGCAGSIYVFETFLIA